MKANKTYLFTLIVQNDTGNEFRFSSYTNDQDEVIKLTADSFRAIRAQEDREPMAEDEEDCGCDEENLCTKHSEKEIDSH